MGLIGGLYNQFKPSSPRAKKWLGGLLWLYGLLGIVLSWFLYAHVDLYGAGKFLTLLVVMVWFQGIGAVACLVAGFCLIEVGGMALIGGLYNRFKARFGPWTGPVLLVCGFLTLYSLNFVVMYLEDLANPVYFPPSLTSPQATWQPPPSPYAWVEDNLGYILLLPQVLGLLSMLCGFCLTLRQGFCLTVKKARQAKAKRQ